MRKTSNRPLGRLMSIDQASDEYGIAPGLLRRLITARALASVEFPGVKRVFIERGDMERLIESSKRKAIK